VALIDDLLAAKAELASRFLQARARAATVPMHATRSVANAVAWAGINVHAVGIGKKIVEGSATPRPCVRVYVVQKLPNALLAPIFRIPALISGIPTDVIESEPAFIAAKKTTAKPKTKAKAKAKPAAAVAAVADDPAAAAVPACSLKRKQRQRPIPAGVSAGHFAVTAGTIGYFCRSTKAGDDSDAVYVLSNNHIFANVNTGAEGDDLYQQGPLDSGAEADAFARLARFVPLKLGGTDKNAVDAAIGRLNADAVHQLTICSIGAVNGTKKAEEDMIVRKHGRTSGLTEGKVTDVSYDALVGMDHNDSSAVAQFVGQMRIEKTTADPVGLGGDSGSLVVDRDETKAVGLYFANPPSGSYGVASHIADVLAALEIELL
jgi:hypothetical protein